MENVLKGIPKVVIYLDDILISGADKANCLIRYWIAWTKQVLIIENVPLRDFAPTQGAQHVLPNK